MPRPLADSFASRSLDTGLPPPLDEAEARDIAGEAWLSNARLYAEVVDLQEHVVVNCNSCDDTVDVGQLCVRCGVDGDYEPQYAWRAIQPGRLRQPGWIVFVHGMNTRGTWQEDLVWQLTLAGPVPTPVRVHKYGRVLVGALSRKALRARACKTAADIGARAREVARHDQPVPGDVVAHSLGTWLIGHALRFDPGLRLGRVILTGSILRPDFEWDTLLEQGRVEQVLNHRAGRDVPVRLARFAIPDSGPSGVVGFDSQSVVDVLDPTAGHSDYFGNRQEQTMRLHLEELWGPLLRWDSRALVELAPEREADLGTWRWPLVGRTRRIQARCDGESNLGSLVRNRV